MDNNIRPTRSIDINIKIDIPGLTAYVAYLRKRDLQQAKVDAITASVKQATSKLRTSTAALKTAVNQNQLSEGE